MNSLTEENENLVERCLQGDGAAWEELFRELHPVLQAAVRSALGLRRHSEVVDEVVARAWFRIVTDSDRSLGRFDVGRGRSLKTFLSAVARNETKSYLRSEQRRKTRERRAGAPESAEASLEPSTCVSEDVLKTLSDAERAYLETQLQPGGDVLEMRFSSDYRRQLRCRVKRKILAHLAPI
ncbi:MAG: hypothetical protein N2C14_13300 [Planctomycetales bacterium]